MFQNLPGLGLKSDSILDILPWYCDDEKLQFEVETVRQAFGDKFKLKWTRFGEPYWEGFIRTPTLSAMIRVCYPDEKPGSSYYPLFPPKAFPIPPIFNSPHIYSSDLSMCLFDPKDPVSMAWNPLADTAAEIIKWADFWLFKQGYWEETGRWPGPEAKHGGSHIPVYFQHFLKKEKKQKRRKR